MKETALGSGGFESRFYAGIRAGGLPGEKTGEKNLKYF
jgi:hypothetical protein